MKHSAQNIFNVQWPWPLTSKMLTLNPWVVIEHSQCGCTSWQQVLKKPSPLTFTYLRVWVHNVGHVVHVCHAKHEITMTFDLQNWIPLFFYGWYVCVTSSICYKNNKQQVSQSSPFRELRVTFSDLTSARPIFWIFPLITVIRSWTTDWKVAYFHIYITFLPLESKLCQNFKPNFAF